MTRPEEWVAALTACAGAASQRVAVPPGVGYPVSVPIDERRGMTGKDTAVLSGRFRIAVPKSVRVARAWEAGQVFAFIPKGAGVMLVPVPGMDRLRGIAKGASARGYRERGFGQN